MNKIPENIHFEILGVSRHSTAAEIKKAYILKIKKWHPDKYSFNSDKHLEALEKSKVINLAYESLKNYNTQELQIIDTSFVKPQKRFNDPNQRSNRKYVDIKRRNVKFANVVSVGYDLKSSILQVKQVNGSIMQFYKVPEEVFNELMFSFNQTEFYQRKIFSKFKKELVK